MRFFIICPLNWEETVLQELREVWPNLLGTDSRPHTEPFPKVEIVPGGLEFESSLGLAVQLNHWLKLASRILLRIDSFKVRDFPVLVKRMHGLNWPKFIGMEKPHFHWEVQASKSRLNNEKRLLACIKEALGAEENLDLPEAYFRMFDDVATLSLDLSGEHLHKRGYSLLKGTAPVRESIAALMVRKMLEDESLVNTQAMTLIDPMCGSGSLLFEAASLYQGNFRRPFAYQKLSTVPKLTKTKQFSLNYKHPTPVPFKNFYGFDEDIKMVEAAKKNLELFLAGAKENPFEFAGQNILEPKQMKGRNWIISNPPYGERIEEMAMKNVVAKMIQAYEPEKIGLLLTPRLVAELGPVPGYRLKSKTKISNGGIETEFIQLVRKSNP